MLPSDPTTGYAFPAADLLADFLIDNDANDPQAVPVHHWPCWVDNDVWELGPPPAPGPDDPAAAALNEIRCCAEYFAGDPCVPTRHLEAAADILEQLLTAARNDPPEPFEAYPDDVAWLTEEHARREYEHRHGFNARFS